MENQNQSSTKTCPACKEQILKDATVCKHCGKKQTSKTTKVLGLIIVGMLALGFISSAISGPSTDSSDQAPQIQSIQITEAQCGELKNEFYSLINQQPAKKTDLGKELLEQYAADAGIHLTKTNPNVTYVLSKSDCGKNLDTALSVIIAGEKKALSEQ